MFAVITAAFGALGYALAARALLLLALIGAFALAAMAMQDPNSTRLMVLIAYCCLTIIPITLLEVRKRS